MKFLFVVFQNITMVNVKVLKFFWDKHAESTDTCRWTKQLRMCVYIITVNLPTLIFGPDLKLIYGTFSENYLDTLFLPSNVYFQI